MADLAAGVRDGRLELLADRVGRVGQVDGALLGESVVDILLVGSCRSMIRPPTSGNCPSRHAERLAVAVVEALGDVAGELEVLALVVADRHEIGLVEQDVARHQHRVREQPGRDELVPVGLLLELRHAAQLAVAGDSRQQPGRLGVGHDVALAEDGRALGVEAGREEHRREVERRLAQLRRVVLDGDRVQVDDAEEAVMRLLGPGVLAEAARCSCRASSVRSAGCPRRRAAWRLLVSEWCRRHRPWKGILPKLLRWQSPAHPSC